MSIYTFFFSYLHKRKYFHARKTKLGANYMRSILLYLERFSFKNQYIQKSIHCFFDMTLTLDFHNKYNTIIYKNTDTRDFSGQPYSRREVSISTF